MLAAVVYIASREIGVGKTLRDIAQGTNVKPKALSHSYRMFIDRTRYQNTYARFYEMYCQGRKQNASK